MKKTLLSLFLLTNLISLGKENSKQFSSHNGFIENKGQIRDQNKQTNSSVKYLLPLNGMNVLIKENGFSYDTYTINNGVRTDLENNPQNVNRKTIQTASTCTLNLHRIDVEFEGINKDVQITATEMFEDYLNFVGDYYPNSDINNVRIFKKIVYKNLYPNIDVEFICDNSNLKEKLEYNFILHPGAKIQDIKMRYKGAQSIKQEGGSLLLQVNHGVITEAIPLSFWQKSKKKENIHYKISNESLVTFEGYNQPLTETLIIDPTPNLDWASYLGETYVSIKDLFVDKDNKIFYCGYTMSSNGIATSGAFQSTIISSNWSGFINCFSTSGVRQWGTYYGCTTGYLLFNSICEDRFGNLILAGETSCSSTVVTPGAHQTTLQGAFDLLLAKFNKTGQRKWATFYGGIEQWKEEMPRAGVDTMGNIYLTGVTSSTSGISTPGSETPNPCNFSAPPDDAFLAKFDSTGVRQWGTYICGSNSEYITGIEIGPDQNPIVVGSTTSNSGIATSGSYQTILDGSSDCFIVKYSSAGNKLWGTYFGANGDEMAWDVASDKNGNIAFCGDTGPGTGLASPGAFQSTISKDFVAKFSNSGQRIWSTYIGDIFNIYHLYGIAMDSLGAVYFGGMTNYNAFNVITPGCFQPNFGGDADAFIAKLDSSCQLVFGTYFGKSTYEIIFALDVTEPNEIYFGGATDSYSGLSTPGCHQPMGFGGPNSGLIGKFSTITMIRRRVTRLIY